MILKSNYWKILKKVPKTIWIILGIIFFGQIFPRLIINPYPRDLWIQERIAAQYAYEKEVGFSDAPLLEPMLTGRRITKVKKVSDNPSYASLLTDDNQDYNLKYTYDITVTTYWWFGIPQRKATYTTHSYEDQK